VTELGDDELERYARQIILPQVGGVGQRRLKTAGIAIVGAGGIGSAVIPALAGAGVGKLTIIDDDDVDRTNLQRQPIFRDNHVGQSKAKLAAEFVRNLNPHVQVAAIQERLMAENAETLLLSHDLVIDGCDNFATRLVVGDTLTGLQIPLVSAAAVQFQGQIGLFRGWEGSKPCYRCFVGDAFDSDDCDTCAERGVLGALTATVGGFAALMAIRAIVGIGEDVAGNLFLFDGISLDWRKISLPKDPNCRTCSA
jgi:molybdopterin/thiamine biosynthesis adenylyltransferase